MRLTLRTLLAYLDDTLEPAQARQIGQKVAESDTAQELIARIKQVTRRRRLTTPPESGPNKLDPNTIAEYLDNTLNADQLADVEQLCLASDVHLAEMASCHQILTLVLGEPALVPPTAKQRMYALVKGREAIPFRKPPGAGGGEADEPQPEGKEVDETLRLGLPALRRKDGWRNPLLIIGGALGLVACLVVAILNLLPSGNPKRPETGGRRQGEEQVAVVPNANDKGAGVKDDKGATPTDGLKKNGPKTEAGAKDGGPKASDKASPGEKIAAPPDKGTKGGPADKTDKAIKGGKAPEVPKSNEVANEPPSPRVVEVGRFEPPTPPATTVLLQLDPDKGGWMRLERQIKPTRVLTARPLVSLPGFRSVIHTDKGIKLTLAGTMPEFFPGTPMLFESLVTLHAHDVLDLDLTLHRGRIFLTNTQERPLQVRVRFENTTDPASNEMWDIILEEKDAEVMIDCFGLFIKPGQPFVANPNDPKREEGPMTQVGLTVTSGSIHLHADNLTHGMYAPPGAARIVWNSKFGWKDPNGRELGPQKLSKLEEWARVNPATPKGVPKELQGLRLDMERACNELSKILAGRPVELGLNRSMTALEAVQRRLTVRCFGAVDMPSQLVDALGDKKHADVRRAAIETLMHWIAASRDNEYKLYADLKERFAPVESEQMIWMLHGPLLRASPQTYELLVDQLSSPRVPIRELAAWQLYAAFPRAHEEIRFEVTQAPELLQHVQTHWRKYLKAQGAKAPG